MLLIDKTTLLIYFSKNYRKAAEEAARLAEEARIAEEKRLAEEAAK